MATFTAASSLLRNKILSIDAKQNSLVPIHFFEQPNIIYRLPVSHRDACRTYQLYLVNLKSGLSILQRQQNLSTIIINVLIQFNQALYRLSHCSNQVNCQIKTPLFVAMIRVIFNFSRTRRTRTYDIIRTSVPRFYVVQKVE